MPNPSHAAETGIAPPIASAPEWPLRAWGLGLVGAIAGFLTFQIMRTDRYIPDLPHIDLRVGASAFIMGSALLFGFLVERTNIRRVILFALAGGVAMGLAAYWSELFGQSDDQWRLLCATMALGIATPLFQAWSGGGRADGTATGGLIRNLPYGSAYRAAWTDVILWITALAFVGIVWAIAILLGQLFRLIGVVFLVHLLGKYWMIFTLTGASLGAGIAQMRDRGNILALLQRVTTTILSILAPALAVGLLIFLIAIPFTGLAPIWGATRSTTPILLGCIVGALCLANAAISEEAAHESRNPLLRASVGALGLAILPLALIAALSIAVRILQHGLTPDRLWATVFTMIACIHGLAYLFVIARYRLNAAPHLRAANLRLAVGLTALLLILATPLTNFGILSTWSQVANLQSGRTPLSAFDWGALRFGFGPAGEKAARKLVTEGKTAEIRAAAAHALKAKDRSELTPEPSPTRPAPIDPSSLVIVPHDSRLPAKLYDRLTEYDACFTYTTCVVLYKPGSTEAIIVTSGRSRLWRLTDGDWRFADGFTENRNLAKVNQGLRSGRVEIRPVTRRQVYVDGMPVGGDFE